MKKITLVLLASVFLTISSCKKDPKIGNDEELITTLIYTLTPTTGTSVIFKFQDLDGEGGNSAIITEGILNTNTTYNADIQVLNESVSPSKNIGEEILEEAEDHQFFFKTNNSILSFSYTDTDSNGNPIGLKNTVNTSSEGTADLTISLKHQPKKPNDGTTADAGGETDIKVQFSVEVQ